MVTNVIPGSPAAEAGIKHGDIITGINGQDVRNRGQWGIADLLCGEAGTELKVDYISGDVLKEAKLTRVQLY